MESVIKGALIVAAIFVLSDYDDFQQFLVIGSEVSKISVVGEKLQFVERRSSKRSNNGCS